MEETHNENPLPGMDEAVLATPLSRTYSSRVLLPAPENPAYTNRSVEVYIILDNGNVVKGYCVYAAYVKTLREQWFMSHPDIKLVSPLSMNQHIRGFRWSYHLPDGLDEQPQIDMM